MAKRNWGTSNNRLQTDSMFQKFVGSARCSGTITCAIHGQGQAVPSLNNVDTISERQSNNFNSLVFDDKLIEVLDGCCHLVLTVTRSIHATLHSHWYPLMPGGLKVGGQIGCQTG